MLTGKNDAITSLASELAAGASTCTVADASVLPATFPYRLRIWDWSAYRQPADDAGSEIVEVTNAVANVLTITRAQEGTSDVLHAAGERCACTVTWAYVEELQTAVATKATSGDVTASGLEMSTGKVLGRATASTGAIEELDVTGTGSVVKATSPTLTSPDIGAATGTSLRLTTLGDAPAANQIAARAYSAYAEGSQAGHVWKTYSSEGSAYGNMIQAWRMRGTFDTPVVCNSGDYVLLVRGWSYDTSGNPQLGATYNIVVDGAPASNRVQMYHVWWTQNSSATLAERMRLHSSGSLTLGTTTDGMTAGGSFAVAQDLAHRGTKVGFYNTSPATKPTVTGSRGSNAALASLLTALAGLGLLTDSSSA